jgi:hypothetical protein
MKSFILYHERMCSSEGQSPRERWRVMENFFDHGDVYQDHGGSM